MQLRAILAASVLAASSACASSVAPAHVPASAVATTASVPVAAAAPTTVSGRGSIVGHVVTNPWHDVKGGAVVYLEDGPKDNGVTSTTLDNHDMEFVPRIAALSAGGSVVFTNTDPMVHNVFSPDGTKFDLGEIAQNTSATKRFEVPGSYVILCNLHQNMRAYIVVAPTNYFARSDADGAFAIKNVPPGTYRVTAWTPHQKSVTQVVTVAGPEVTANFNLER
jgi:plastocyanin